MYSINKIEPNTTTFPGIYIGVVEDNQDPNKAGRVRVRILGLHSDSKNIIASENLPWAIPIIPLFEGGTSGIGMYSVPVTGSWVTLFFIGGDHNYPAYFGCIAGNPQSKAKPSEGFNDPNGIYPTIVREPDWNRLSREIITLKTNKDASRITNISQSSSDASWEEPKSAYKATYPYNSVLETRGNGTIIEFDSTPGNERYHRYHKNSGTFLEIDTSGNSISKIQGNKYDLVKGTRYLYTDLNYNSSINGDKDTYINGTENTSVFVNSIKFIRGNRADLVVGSDTKVVVTDKLEAISGIKTSIIVGGKIETITGPSTETITGPSTETITGKTIVSAAPYNITAPQINLNGGIDSVVLANMLLTYLNTHTHSGVTTGAGTSGPPATPATSLQIASLTIKGT